MPISKRAFTILTAALCIGVFGAVYYAPVETADVQFSHTYEFPQFSCTSPYHHDGDNIQCPGGPKGRLYGIDAPEMPGACRPGRKCTPGDPIASRDNLRSLTAGKRVVCNEKDTDHYGRVIVRCVVGALDLSCAQIDSGHAVARYGKSDC